MSLDDVGSSSTDNFDSDGLCQPGQENTGRWTSDEHRLFLKGLELHGKGWKQIATLIQTRTVVQIRTHAQKYFQKLSKAQASGTSHLDPATLMSTMDAGKPRPASVARNLRSSTITNNTAESEGRLMSLRNRRNRGRHSRHGDEQVGMDSSSDGSNGGGSSDSDGASEEEEERDDGEALYRQKPGMLMMVRQGAPKFAVDGGSSNGARVPNEEGNISSIGAGTKSAWGNRQLMPGSKSNRPSPTKPSKTITTASGGGAADARALAWEAASVKSHAVGADTPAEEATTAAAGAAAAAAAVVAAGNATGTKRNRSESISSTSSLGDAIKNLKRTGGSQGTRISPTSVSDINFMSFPVPHTEHSDVAMHHLPQQLAPSWCTKPQDAWMAGAGFDIGGDSDDAGPFRWFIDERSLSAPGAFFQPPVETWSGSDTTDASVAAGATSGGEDSTVDGDRRTIVPEVPVSTNKIDMSPVTGNTCERPNSDDVASKRKCTEATAPMPTDSQAYVPVSDAAIASEVTRHVEADNATGGDGLDITSGLWLDHPQEASPLMDGLGLSAPPVAGLGGGLSLPSLDEDEVLGFLACAENRPAGDIEV
eukprot:g17695.t1